MALDPSTQTDPSLSRMRRSTKNCDVVRIDPALASRLSQISSIKGPLWVISGHSTRSSGVSAFGPKADLVMRASESPLSANSGHLIMVLLGSEKDRLTVAKELVAEVALALAVVVARAAVPEASVCFRGSGPAGLA